ncbi:MAG: hypothetical protein F6K42_00540 [Leptolyngbya sp. SIO1D8]|nr:hypothetical protein [Leptolyngbya sp. SIO1D8]
MLQGVYRNCDRDSDCCDLRVPEMSTNSNQLHALIVCLRSVGKGVESHQPAGTYDGNLEAALMNIDNAIAVLGDAAKAHQFTGQSQGESTSNQSGKMPNGSSRNHCSALDCGDFHGLG